MNIGNIITDLARYRKPTVKDFAIKPLRRVRIGEPMIAENVLPVITDRGSVSGKAFTDFSIREVIDTEKMGMDERSQVLFQKCVGHKKCQASIG